MAITSRWSWRGWGRHLVGVGIAVGCSMPLSAQETPRRRDPLPQVRYELGPDSKKQDGVPEGKLEGPFLFRSKNIPDTVRKYWVSVPARLPEGQKACVLVFQDGARAINPNGVLRVPVVLDNLMARSAIPPTVGIYITPGQRGDEFPDSIGTGNPNNRDREYDVLDDHYARMVIDEILPEVARRVPITDDPKGRAIGGSSSGAICAFTVAWHRPDQFRNVVSLIGSFTNIHGGHVYPDLIRTSDAKPIRIFLQDGRWDLRNPQDPDRDWFLQNQAMVKAFQEKEYDFVHVFGEGGHSDDHGGAMLPEMLQWIWRDYPGVESPGDEELLRRAQAYAPSEQELFPGFDAQATVNPEGKWQWELPGRNRRVEVLTLERRGDHWHGSLQSKASDGAGDAADPRPIDRIELVGNKLYLDVQREFRGASFWVTLVGIVRGDALEGWSLSDAGGSPRDTRWNAKRVPD